MDVDLARSSPVQNEMKYAKEPETGMLIWEISAYPFTPFPCIALRLFRHFLLIEERTPVGIPVKHSSIFKISFRDIFEYFIWEGLENSKLRESLSVIGQVSDANKINFNLTNSLQYERIQERR